MALTPFRWIAGLIIGCLVASILVLRGPRSRQGVNEYEVRERLESAMNRLDEHAATAARRLHLLQVLDSARPSVERAARTQAIRVFRDAKLTPAAIPEIDWLVARATRQVRDSGRVPLDLIFVYDTLSKLRGAGISRGPLTTSYLLPARPGDRCTVVVRFNYKRNYRWSAEKVLRSMAISTIRNERTADQLLGPCAYYRAFGMPGASIDRWLQARAMAFARDAAWDQQPSPLFLDPRAWRYYYDNGGYYVDFQSGVSWAGPLGVRITPLVFMSPAGAQCALGDPPACEREMLFPANGARGLTWNGNVASGSLGQGSVGFASFGPREPMLLAEMVRSMGRDRFAKFWTSPDSVPTAFEKAAGEPLGTWTARWANATYDPSPPGPGIAIWGAVFSVLLVALGLLVAARASERRQFQ